MEHHHHPIMNHLWFPPSQGSFHASTALNWSIQWVSNTLFHDVVSFSDVPLLGGCFIQFPRPFMENLTFISHEAFPHKNWPLSPAQILCFFLDGYLSPIHPAYLKSHLEAFSWKIYPIPFLNEIWQESHLLVPRFSKWSIY